MRGRAEDNCIPSQNSDAPSYPHHQVTDWKTLQKEKTLKQPRPVQMTFRDFHLFPRGQGTAYTVTTTVTSDFDLSY